VLGESQEKTGEGLICTTTPVDKEARTAENVNSLRGIAIDPALIDFEMDSRHTRILQLSFV
jgi:hypothetical protein